MSDEEQRMIFSKNLLRYIEEYDKTQAEVADAIGVSPQTFNTWCRGIAIPRMGKVQALAEYFHINKSCLIDEKSDDSSDIPYYISDEAREMAEFLHKSPEYKVLFDASRKVSAEDIDTVKAIIDKFRSPDYD